MLGTIMQSVMVALAIAAGVALLAHVARRAAHRVLPGWQAWDDAAFKAPDHAQDSVTAVDHEDLR